MLAALVMTHNFLTLQATIAGKQYSYERLVVWLKIADFAVPVR